MPANRLFKRMLTTAALTVSGGLSLLWIPSCETVLTTFNPCGNIFAFCDPNDIPLAFTDVPNFELDPTCTIPYLEGCSAGNIFPNNNRP